MALEFNTIGVKLKWCCESVAGSRPTTGYQEIPDIKSTPSFDFNPSKLQVTNLSDKTHRYMDGVQDTGDSYDYTANLTNDLKTKWESMYSAAQTAWASSKSTWFETVIPNFGSFYFAGRPNQLGINEMGVDAVIETTLHIVPNQIAGFAASST